MPRYEVIKELKLRFECVADNAEDAEEQCINTDDREMSLFDCQYEVELLDFAETPDHELTIEQLDDKYNSDGNGQHPDFGRHDWRIAVSKEQTFLGYWDWVKDSVNVAYENSRS